MNNYRPIALTPCIMKVFERIFITYLQSVTSKFNDPNQFAYRTNRLVDDVLLCMFTYRLLASPRSMVAAPTPRHSYTPLLPIPTHVHHFTQRQATAFSDVFHIRDWWSSSVPPCFNLSLEHCCHQICYYVSICMT